MSTSKHNYALLMLKKTEYAKGGEKKKCRPTRLNVITNCTVAKRPIIATASAGGVLR